MPEYVMTDDAQVYHQSRVPVPKAVLLYEITVKCAQVQDRCRVPVPKALLLYGAHGSGKTMLAHAIAHESGACLFDISPCVTDGKYAGKAVTMMMHMVSTFCLVHLCCCVYACLDNCSPLQKCMFVSIIALNFVRKATHAKHDLPSSSLLCMAAAALLSCLFVQVFKVAREVGPSMIYLDDAEKVSTIHICMSS